MDKATEFFQEVGRSPRRRERLPRLVVWLAVLIALAVAVLGVVVTQSATETAKGSGRQAPGASTGVAPGI